MARDRRKNRRRCSRKMRPCPFRRLPVVIVGEKCRCLCHAVVLVEVASLADGQFDSGVEREKGPDSAWQRVPLLRTCSGARANFG